MTNAAGDSGTSAPLGTSPPRRRARYKPIVAALVLAGPLLGLVALDLAALLQAFLDPQSTCWLKPHFETGGKVLYPFEIHLLFFTATLQFWAPVVLLLVVLFWYLEWIRLRELALLVLLCSAVLYVVGFELQWMADLYRGRYAVAACA